MNKKGLIHAMLKKAHSMENAPSPKRNQIKNQVTALQFMDNEIESIKEAINGNLYRQFEGMFSFCENRILNSNLDITETGIYQISTERGVFKLDRAALLTELSFTQKVIKALLSRQATIETMSTLAEDEREALVKDILKEDYTQFTKPGLFTSEKLRSLAKGRQLLASHMAKEHAFDAGSEPNKNLNRFINILFSNVKKQQALSVKNDKILAEHVGVLTK